MKIQLCPAIVQVCVDFADKRMADSESLYRARGEMNKDKIRQDIITGSLAEYAIYEYFTEMGYKCTMPDMKIYKPGQKSFAPDLLVDGKVVHVKSQSIESAAKYGASWLFQKEDRVLGTPSETALMAFCLVDGNTVDIQAVVKVMDIVENNLTAKPKVWRYANSKNAIYLDDILRSKINLWAA